MAAEKETEPTGGGIRRGAAADGNMARELGPNAVTHGALERAEAAVTGTSYLPKNQEQSDNLTRAYVTPDGKVSTTPPDGSAVQLVGAEAEAYLEKHGGKKAAKSDEAKADTAAEPKKDEEKAAPKAANKARKAAGTKS